MLVTVRHSWLHSDALDQMKVPTKYHDSDPYSYFKIDLNTNG